MIDILLPPAGWQCPGRWIGRITEEISGGRQSEAMQGDCCPKTHLRAASHSRARRLAGPPGSLRSPVPPKGRTNPRRGRDLNPKVVPQIPQRTVPTHGSVPTSGGTHPERVNPRLTRTLSNQRSLAEREGFEPSRRLTPPTRLAGERLRPLGHLSGCHQVINRSANGACPTRKCSVPLSEDRGPQSS